MVVSFLDLDDWIIQFVRKADSKSCGTRENDLFSRRLWQNTRTHGYVDIIAFCRLSAVKQHLYSTFHSVVDIVRGTIALCSAAQQCSSADSG